MIEQHTPEQIKGCHTTTSYTLARRRTLPSSCDQSRTDIRTCGYFLINPDGVNQHLMWNHGAAAFVAVNLGDDHFHGHAAYLLVTLI